ncbi:MAG TPA: NADP-dependent oxidoreductase [Steroidobacteraceae bacterium]|nr:NADP-dependent oxidoreductase [Steroidobacteraceae bacterium]
MKAIALTAYGQDPAVLKAVELPTPQIGPNEVLVEVHAAGFNPFDCKIRKGYLQRFYPLQLPHVIGNDFAGIVADAGPGVFHVRVGDRVYGLQSILRPGVYAEYTAIEASLVRRMPSNLSFVEAASLPMVYQTAWMGLAGFAQVRTGQLVLVHAATGGVGSAAVQLARAMGGRVAATSRSDGVDFVRALGADITIDYEAQDFTALLRNVDVVFDPIGGQVNLDSYRVVRRGGVILVVLREDKLEMENRSRLEREYGVATSVIAFENLPEVLDFLRPLFENGTLKPVVSRVLPLAQAMEAHRLSDAGHARGKTVLRVRE